MLGFDLTNVYSINCSGNGLDGYSVVCVDLYNLVGSLVDRFGFVGA